MLSDSKIRSAKPKEKLYRIGDSDGLCIEIKPNGKKYWRYRFQWLKKTQMMSLGEYPIVGLAEARTKRDEAKSLVASGINPVEEKENQKKLNLMNMKIEFSLNMLLQNIKLKN